MKNYKEMYEAEYERAEYWKKQMYNYSKKYLSWASFGLIVIGIVGLSIFVYFVNWVSIEYPNYYIYKTECHNETSTNSLINALRERISILNNMAIIYVKMKNNSKSFDEKLLNEFSNLSKEYDEVIEYEQVCEEKEVDEMYILIGNCFQYRNNDCPYLIKKSEITKERLNNNCECLELGCKIGFFKYEHGNRKDCYTPFMIHCLESNKGICAGDEGTNYNQCLRYKCGEYTVEAR